MALLTKERTDVEIPETPPRVWSEEAREAWDRLQELRSELTEVEDRIAELRTRQDGTESDARKDAERLLAGEELDGPPTGGRADLDAARRRRRALQEAEAMAERRYARAAGEATRDLADKLLPAHREMMAEILEKAVELGRLVDTEHAFRERVRRASKGEVWMQKLTTAATRLAPLRLSDEHATIHDLVEDLVEDYDLEDPR